MQQIYTHSYFKKCELYNLSKLNGLINHPSYEEISKRLKIINFYDRYGLSATKEAYGIGRYDDDGIFNMLQYKKSA